MKKSKFTPSQIASILKAFDEGRRIEKLTREKGITRQTFYL
jgi:putative transposase